MTTVFVYGTLLPEFVKPALRADSDLQRIMPHLRLLGPGVVAGYLFDLGPFPGLVLDPATESTVVGEVYEIDHSEILALLDAWEDQGLAERLFDRTRCTVKLLDGSEIECWVYTYRGELGAAPRIVGGDYRAWQAAKVPAHAPAGSEELTP